MTDSRDPLDLILSEAAEQTSGLSGLPAPGPSEPDDEALLRYLDAPSDDPIKTEQLRREAYRTPWSRSRTLALTEARQELARATAAAAPADSLATPAALRGAAAQVRIAFARAGQGLQFLWGTIQPTSLSAAPVPTRGAAGREAPDTAAVEESTFFDFAHQFGPLGVRIQVERLPDDRMDLQLDFQASSASDRPLRVDLTDAAGTLLDSQPVEHGVARFAALTPTTHDLLIRAADTRVGHVRFDVRA